MSGLDAFIPQLQEPADLRAALRKFAEWVEQQKTTMEATVRAEVAKVDQATITANVLAQMPVTVAPFRVDVKDSLLTFDRRQETEFTVPVPEGARSVKISARGGPYSFPDAEEKCLAAPWVHGWFDLGSARGLVVQGSLGVVNGSATLNTSTLVGITKPNQSPPKVYLALKAPYAVSIDIPSDHQNAINLQNGGNVEAVISKVILEWYKTVPEGATQIGIS